MDKYRDPSGGSLSSLLSGAILGAAGLAWWLFSEAERRNQTRRQKAMLYAPRIQDGSEAFESTKANTTEHKSVKLEERVEKLNAAIADVRKQLEELGEND